VTIKNSIAPGVIADHGNRLFGNIIRSAEGEELVQRLNAMFERANSTGQVVNQRELSTVLSVRRSEGSPGDRSIAAFGGGTCRLDAFHLRDDETRRSLGHKRVTEFLKLN
jgi:hypothetical protein